MVYNESALDLFQSEVSEDVDVRSGEERGFKNTLICQYFKCSCRNHQASRLSDSKNVKISDNSENCIRDNCREVRCEVNTESCNEEISPSLIGNTDSPGLGLHISSGSEEHVQEPKQNLENKFVGSDTESSEDLVLSANESLSVMFPDRISELREKSRVDICHKNSPDIFISSQEQISPVEDIHVQSKISPPASRNVATTSSTRETTSDNNRENLEEWNSQQLADLSRSLKTRSKQIKRLIMAVIRKKQMEDETLEAFKKRLKRF